jgi:hypothetical protein
MLNERDASALHYDAPADAARVVVGGAKGKTSTRSAKATLLLDAAGFLVGVDVEPDSASRTVVLLGRHEDVARTASAKIDATYDAGGSLCEVRIANAKRAIRAHERNPYR